MQIHTSDVFTQLYGSMEQVQAGFLLQRHVDFPLKFHVSKSVYAVYLMFLYIYYSLDAPSALEHVRLSWSCLFVPIDTLCYF